MKKFPPREGDLPRDELLKRAQEIRTESEGSTDIHFKFTCEGCGERCMLAERNTLYENGECHKCGHVTAINFGGFAMVTNLKRVREMQRRNFN
jgi:hypothetical protein